MKKLKICLACCAGGHLKEMMAVVPFIKQYDHYFVTLDRVDVHDMLKKEKVFFVNNTDRNIFKTLYNFIQSIILFLKNKSDIIITTGAGAALPTCILAKVFHKKILFIESFTRISEPSLFGKLVYPIADTTLVQWKSLLKHYKKARYVGPIFSLYNQKKKYKKQKLVFVTVGTSASGFERLLKQLDLILQSNKFNYKFFAQIGSSDYIPKNYQYVKWLNYNEMVNYLSKSEIVITHAGVGSIINALERKTKVIAVPRKKRYNEHIDNHQMELTHELEKQSIIFPVYSIKNLKSTLNQAIKANYRPIPFESHLKKEMKQFLGECQ
jgi:UDP-N-acetylglucosamine transferase subunit ALG13